MPYPAGHVDFEYRNLVRRILDTGEKRPDRTGTGTLSLFAEQIKLDCLVGFPLITTKKVFWKGVREELLWFLSGSTNNNDLEKRGVSIWRAWAKPDGSLGPIYGHQWIAWPNFEVSKGTTYKFEGVWGDTVYEKSPTNQIKQAIDLLKKDPFSRRNVVSAWNVSDISKMAMPPCHAMFQLYCSTKQDKIALCDQFENIYDGYIDMHMYQRSCDVALGLPFNIASYALLLDMFARECNRVPRYLTISFGDVHVYLNHVDGLTEQLNREPKELPDVHIANWNGIFNVKSDDIELVGYNPHKAIPFDISV